MYRFIPAILISLVLFVVEIPTISGAHVRGNHSHISTTHMSSLSTTCSTSGPINCYDCLAANNDTTQLGNYTWCTKPEFCFLMDGSENGNTCFKKCFGGYYRDGKSARCDDSNYTIGAVIVSFVLLVICPLCLACGCCYVIVIRCRNLVENKVAADNEIIAFAGSSVPIPLLQVYQGNEAVPQQSPAGNSRALRTAGQEEASFVFAEARVAAGDDSEELQAGAQAAAVQQVGMSGRMYALPPASRTPASAALYTSTVSSAPLSAPAYAQSVSGWSSGASGRAPSAGERH